LKASASKLLALWVEADLPYQANENDGTGERDGIKVVEGEGPIVLTAPHAVAHIREGRRKEQDSLTGGLAEVLARATGNACITAIGPQSGDANRDLRHPFKDEFLARQLHEHRLVLDLHGMRDQHGLDLCVGRGMDPDDLTRDVADLASDLAETARITAAVDHISFGAKGRGTVTTFVQKHGRSCIQIEIAARLRDPDGDRRSATAFLDWLLKVLDGARAICDRAKNAAN
jgi:hypothetical protein